MTRLRADLPLPEQLRRSLLDIAVGEPLDRDGEARTVDLERIRWPRLEPSAALMQRLARIPDRRIVRRPGAATIWRGPTAAVTASYLLAAALTLAVGDPVALGRRASSELRAAAGEHVLEPAARAGSLVQTGVSRRLAALQDRVRPAVPFGLPLTVPAGRVQAWFRGAARSSADMFRGLTGFLPLDTRSGGEEPAATDRPHTDSHRRETDHEGRTRA